LKLRINIKFAGIGLAVAVALTMAPGAEAGARIPADVPEFGLILTESFDLNIEGDAFYADANNPDSRKIYLCDGPSDKLCTDTTMVHAIHNLPFCSVDDTLDCISAVWAVDPNGKKIDGIYQTALPVNSKNDHAPYPSMWISAARGLGGLWKIPGVINSGGEDNYFVSMRNDAFIEKAAGRPLLDYGIYYGNLMAGIIPVQQVKGNFRQMTSGDARTPGRIGWGSSGLQTTSDGEKCTVTDVGICELPRNFPAGYRFGMSVRLMQGVSGWFHGRIALPQISGKEVDKRREISIEAEPVKISTLDFLIPNAKIPDSVRKIIFADVDWGIQGNGKGGIQTMLNGLSEPLTMEIMNAMLPVIGDKATKTTEYWAYRALNAWRNPEVRKCSEKLNELGGVVTTNALTYSAGPPSFDKETGSLDYKVASPHFDADGKVALGTYDLAIKSSVARCIYGFTNAPIHASISIVGDGGEEKVATTVVNERDGWLYMSAKGFTFSSPTIKVKLSQDAAPTSKATGTKSTITCIKGKLSKKVTGTNPKCPSGYKKK
jgi:hypothetical protein